MAPPSASTNGMAIASLVCSLVGCGCGVGWILGVVFGIIALRQIKQTGQAGHGLALAGLIVGGIGIAFGVVYLIFIIIVAATSTGDHSTAAGLITLGQYVFPQAVPA
jgi:hypothetical protein